MTQKRLSNSDEILVDFLNAGAAQSQGWNVMPCHTKDLLIYPYYLEKGDKSSLNCTGIWGLINISHNPDKPELRPADRGIRN